MEEEVKRHPLTLRKPERLRHRTLVNELFERGSSLYAFPLRMQWLFVPASRMKSAFRDGRPDGIDPLQRMIVIPKRKMRHAVDRVLLRRRVREAYRLNRLPLLHLACEKSRGGVLLLSFIYISDKICEYGKVERAVRRLLDGVGAELAKIHDDETESGE